MRSILRTTRAASRSCFKCHSDVTCVVRIKTSAFPFLYYTPCGHAVNSNYDDTLTPEEIAMALLMLEGA
jgi:hypothetical protein